MEQVVSLLKKLNENEPAMFKRSIAHLKKHDRENQQSVRRLLVVLIGSVFFIETFLMGALALLPPMSETLAALLDAALLSLLLFPIFYYLIFRPLVRNIAKREQVEEDLRIAAVAFEIKDPTLITDAKANIIRANRKLLDKLGYNMEEIVGKNPRIFKSGLHDRKYYEQLWKQLLQTGHWSGEIRIRSKEGRILHPFWLTITAVKNEQQETTHYIGIYNF
ncbi:diguanylate cyclase/phosphodiesterase with PAS/PAC sensor(s) [Sideroxydans sp. CL21]|nr:diguanylate cyclase/phosphodiesterase with PAS/PAC sensor(s) [Sideroxydans sp. CL21]